MKNVTIVIHTRNEEKNIVESIESARLLSKNILVVDMESSDRTVAFAEKLGAVVYTFSPSRYVEPARKFGIQKTKTDWVLILDADERVTKELSREILKPLQGKRVQDDKFTHYKIPRRNVFGKKWLRHGGWWPDYQIRLINKKFFRSWPKRIHSTPQIKGSVGYLKNPLLHFFHGDLSEMVNKTTVFEDVESDLLYKAGRQVKLTTFFRKYFAELWRRLIKGAGFLDGPLGIIEAIYQAYSKTITQLFLYEKKHK